LHLVGVLGTIIALHCIAWHGNAKFHALVRMGISTVLTLTLSLYV
jgi:hypothetical protein